MKLKVSIRCVCGAVTTVVLDGKAIPCSKCGAKVRAETEGDRIRPWVVFRREKPKVVKTEWVS